MFWYLQTQSNPQRSEANIPWMTSLRKLAEKKRSARQVLIGPLLTLYSVASKLFHHRGGEILVWSPDQITCNSKVMGTPLPQMLLLSEPCHPSPGLRLVQITTSTVQRCTPSPKNSILACCRHSTNIAGLLIK